MSEPTPAQVAVAFTEAWTSHDMERAAGYVAHDVVYDGPANHIRGRQAYIEALERFAVAVTSMNVISVFGDDEQALIMYEVQTGLFGPLTCGERVVVSRGRIISDRVAFDTFPIRKAPLADAA